MEANKLTVYNEYLQRGKTPILVVGTNTWIHQNVSYELRQKYDMYITFYPNKNFFYVVGLILLNRIDNNIEPIKILESGTIIKKTIEKAFDYVVIIDKKRETHKSLTHLGVNMWILQWIYHCPKISLKDVLMLEPYPNVLEEIETESCQLAPFVAYKIIGGKL